MAIEDRGAFNSCTLACRNEAVSPNMDDILKAKILMLLDQHHIPTYPLANSGKASLQDLKGIPLALPDVTFGVRRILHRAMQEAGLIREHVSPRIKPSLGLLGNSVGNSTSDGRPTSPPITLNRTRS